MSTLLDGARLKAVRYLGAGMSGDLIDACVKADFKASTTAVTSIDFEFQDDAAAHLWRTGGFTAGATISYGDWRLRVSSVTLDKGVGGPLIKQSADSRMVTALRGQKGPKNWGTTDVSAWVAQVTRSVGFYPLVQGGLGRKQITRVASGDTASGPTDTWAVLVEMAKQCGAWLFEYGTRLVFGRPSWINAQTWQQTWPLRVDSWDDYTDGLLGWPVYGFDETAEPASRETMTVRLRSTDADEARPGDRVTVNGDACASMGGTWIVGSVAFPMNTTDPVTLTCQRVIDPKPQPPAGKATDKTITSTTSTTIMGVNTSVPRLAGPVAGYNAEQLYNAALIVRTGQVMGLTRHALQLGVCCAMGESGLRNLNYGDAAGPDSVGAFQQRANGAWGSYADRTNVSTAARNFFRALVKVPGYLTIQPTLAIHRTQINADPNHYTKYWAAAVTVTNAILDAERKAGTQATTTTAGNDRVNAFVNQWNGRGIDYDGYYGAQCMDLYAQYVRDVVGGKNTPTGAAKNLWSLHALDGDFTRVTGQGIKGDVAIWDGRQGGGYGHVAIVLRDNGSSLQIFSQNPGPARIMTLSKAGLLGFLRPKHWRK